MQVGGTESVAHGGLQGRPMDHTLRAAVPTSLTHGSMIEENLKENELSFYFLIPPKDGA